MKNIWTAYKYIFYREYTWHKKKLEEKDIPHITTIFSMSLNFIVAGIILFILLNAVFDVKLELTTINKITVLLIALIVLIFHYYLFIFKKRYLTIEEEFTGESKRQRYINGWFVVLYSIGTVLSLIILMVMLGHR